MTASGGSTCSLQAGRAELILQQLDALPTLSSVAVRLLELTTSDDSNASDVIELITADPSLTAKVLKLCACQDRMSGGGVPTIERAVKLLGFDAVRSAVLSVEVFDLFDRTESAGGERVGEQAESEKAFDRNAFWRHSLATAVLCESLAASSPSVRDVKPGEAFIGGLLHNLGLLALHVVLPKTIDRVCRFNESHAVSLDEACRRIVGLDHFTAGKRLAEHWRLPHALVDVMWLHGHAFAALPDVPHRSLIGLCGLASAIARSRYAAASGQAPRGEPIEDMCAAMAMPDGVVERASETIDAAVTARGRALGLALERDESNLIDALGRANGALGRMNASLRAKAAASQRHERTLEAIRRFHDAAAPGGSLTGVLGTIVRSAFDLFGGSVFAFVHQKRVGEAVQFIRFEADGRAVQSKLFPAPPSAGAIADMDDTQQVSGEVLSLLPWLSDEIETIADMSSLKLLPLRCGWGVHAVLIHDAPVDGREEAEALATLTRTWGAAVAACCQHDGAKRLGEDVAAIHRQMMAMQAEVARSRAWAMLGEVAAGAAHEMNNPLTVISGRSQMLANFIEDEGHRSTARQIHENAHRLSELISELRGFAERTTLNMAGFNVHEMVIGVVEEIAHDSGGRGPEVVVDLQDGLPQMVADEAMIARALGELIRNATETEGSSKVRVSVGIDALDDRWTLSVTDDGEGLSEHVLEHAFDPFFSAKPAGRQTGLGLARVRQIVDAHGGDVTLTNGPDGGARCVIRMDREPLGAQHAREAA